MLKVNKTQADGWTNLAVVGVIDAQTPLVAAAGPLAGNVRLDLAGVAHINSLGVKHLMGFLRGLEAALPKVELVHCSPAIVEQLNLVPSLAGRAEVVSICLPYVCEKCPRDLLVAVNVKELQAARLAVPPVNCNVCKSPAVFDDVAEEYFSFLAVGN